VFHLNVTKVDLGCFIYCNENIHMFQGYVQSVSVVSNICFKCFHLDVTYVAMAAHTCFKCLFSYVSDVSDLCCKNRPRCCIFCYGYTHMFQEHVSNVSSVFSYLLQIFHLYVSKVGVLHMLHCVLVAAARASSWFTCGRGRGRPGAAVGVPPWFTCGRGGTVPNAGARCKQARGATVVHMWAWGRGSKCWCMMRVGMGRGTRCGWMSGAGAELRLEGRRLWSRIWHRAKGVSCVG
jgi:hypothetical protein